MTNLITRSVIVKTPVEKAYQVWSNFENFPNFMENITEVKYTGTDTSHWKMKGPLGKTLEWNAYTTLAEENSRIGWSTKDNDEGDVITSGQVTFSQLSQGETQVTVILKYEPKQGLAGDIVEKFLANPEEKLDKDLRNFKAYVEGRRERTQLT